MEARPGEAYHNILLTLLLPIGDTLFATPTIRALRRAYPRAHISAVVFPTNRAVLENNPDVDRLLVHATRESWPGSAAFLHFFARRRHERYDLAVHFAAYHGYYGLACGIPRQLQLPCPWLSWLIPHANHGWRQRHAIHTYLSVLRPLGLAGADDQPRLELSADQHTFAADYLARHGASQGELLLGLHPGGSGFRGMKRWAPEGFGWVAGQLAKRRPVRLIFFGSGAERPLAEAAAACADGLPAINACGATTLSQTIALLGRIDVVIGNDSGPLHLAAALGTRAVGVYGPTNRETFRPIGPRVRVVTGSVPCPGNYGFFGSRPIWAARECQGECLASIDPAHVLQAAEELLAGGAPCPPPARAANCQPPPRRVAALQQWELVRDS
ncbi:MAG: glycosyltransferase family 9 protein [Chloroflexota bacterium]